MSTTLEFFTRGFQNEWVPDAKTTINDLVLNFGNRHRFSDFMKPFATQVFPLWIDGVYDSPDGAGIILITDQSKTVPLSRNQSCVIFYNHQRVVFTHHSDQI